MLHKAAKFILSVVQQKDNNKMFLDKKKLKDYTFSGFMEPGKDLFLVSLAFL